MGRLSKSFATCAIFVFAAGAVFLSTGVAAETSRPLPRFASLRAGEVNLRTGPGVRYPVDWVFLRRGLPVEITAEFDTWRKIRDWQGTEGWVHKSMLSGRRTFMVTGGVQKLRLNNSEDAPLSARIEKNVVGRILDCRGGWCRVEVSGLRGWLKRDQFWGVYPGEKIK